MVGARDDADDGFFSFQRFVDFVLDPISVIDVHARYDQNRLGRAELIVEFSLEGSLAICMERLGVWNAVIAPMKARFGVEQVDEPCVLGVACPCVAYEEIVVS